MIVNLNVMCKVRLNDFGKVIWLSQVDSLPEDIKSNRPDIVAAIKNAIKEDNTVETELWSIMNIFGPYMTPTSMPFDTTTIELNKNPNFGNYS